MRRALLAAIGGSVAVLSMAAAPPRIFGREASRSIESPSCAVCHPGAVEGLGASRHRSLLQREGDGACASCHGDLSAHVESARHPEATLVHAASVAASACAVCHERTDWTTALGRHTWRAGIESDSAVVVPPDPELVVPREPGIASFDWRGLVEIGNRFVSRSGSAGRYDTDLNLDSGPRLVDARLTGEGHADLLDRIELRARDIGDPWSRISAEILGRDSYRARVSREDRVFHRRTRGDYSRVSHDEESDSADLEIDLSAQLSAFASFEHFEDDGHWITQRLAGRGSTPLLPVIGVDSPRTLDSDSFSAGLRYAAGGTRLLAALDYTDEIAIDRWRFDRPAPANPLLRESEDFATHGHTHGPAMRAELESDVGPLHFELRARHRTLERDTDSTGTLTGVDPIEFVTSSQTITRGDSATTWLDGTLTADIDDRLSLTLDLGWRHHDEHQLLDSVEITDFPGVGGSSAVTQQFDQRTRQERFDGAVALDSEITDGVVLTLGAGFSHERLRLPELPSGGLDPSRGTVRDAGSIAGLRWKPDSAWTLDARFQDFGQTGLVLEEQQRRDACEWRARVRRQVDGLSVEAGVAVQRARNDGSDYRFDRDTVTLVASQEIAKSTSLSGSYVFSDTDSSTLTNFYFDPDPTPIATIVGFRGRTHTLSAGVGLDTEQGVSWRTDLSWTHTSGSSDLDTLDLRSDLSVEVVDGGSLGARYQHIDYREDGGLDDFRADLLLVYWRQRIGPAQR